MKIANKQIKKIL
jgi:hypothetical protein